MGLASHLGVLVNIPTIGVAKRLLAVKGIDSDHITHKVDYPLNYEKSEPLFSQYMTKKGGFYKITAYEYDQYKNKHTTLIIGAALRTRENENCVYVSLGHRVSLVIALRIVMDCCLKHRFRLPFPVYQADKLSRIEMRTFEREYQNPYAFNLHQNTREYNRIDNNRNHNNGSNKNKNKNRKKNNNNKNKNGNRNNNVNYNNFNNNTNSNNVNRGNRNQRQSGHSGGFGNENQRRNQDRNGNPNGNNRQGGNMNNNHNNNNNNNSNGNRNRNKKRNKKRSKNGNDENMNSNNWNSNGGVDVWNMKPCGQAIAKKNEWPTLGS